ncbi:MAG TPA: hypothetical protein VEC14_00085 [Reyranellaceae bacterium]|nr:hypothetical protein [Reyranellaceae bacterium]
MTKTLNALVIAGAVFVLLGIMGFAMPVFFTTETHDAIRIGDLFRVQVTEREPHRIPPLASTAALVLGIVLFALGVFRKRA